MKPEPIPHPYACELQMANLRATRSGRTYEAELETLLSGEEWKLPPPPPAPPPTPEQIALWEARDAALDADDEASRKEEEVTQ